MNNKLTAKQRKHLQRIKEMGCSLCDAPPPSDAHHIRQHSQFLCIPLCRDCHNSHHGTKALWRVRKMDELDALEVTVRRLLDGR